MLAEGLTSEEKTLSVLSHLSPLIGHFIVVGHLLVPLVILLWKGKESDYIDYHAREALNFQISMTIYWIITVVLCFVLIGFLIALGLLIFELIVIIMAAVKASDGEPYRYPLCIRFLSN